MAEPRKAVLFDLDGTLVNTGPLILTSFALTIEEVLGESHPPETYLSGVGIPLRAQMERLAVSHRGGDMLTALAGGDLHLDGTAGTIAECVSLGTLGSSEADRLCAVVDDMMSAYQRHNARIHDELIEPFEGIEQQLEAFAAVGVPMGVVTSKRHRSAYGDLAHFGLERFFPILVAADDVELHKPHPFPLLYGLERLAAHHGISLSPAEAAYVGDSPYDMVASNAAGTLSAAAVWGMFGEDALREHEPAEVLCQPVDLGRLRGERVSDPQRCDQE